ncbi:MAG TPA: polysaccharide deacetylase family protein [Albidovulum sp.]|uniref:polysaccharide deacetylase family protein n=1 Tax=Albidovulum sp. TaxID=1872424 RepID=UPI002C3FB4F4|nr:polysaccharide deacetylase family protein [Albidovulum sp.]
MTGSVTDILMYHSISGHGGATAIAPGVFAAQMRAIAEAGAPVITLDDYCAAKAGGPALPARSVIITFDDGFQDFADVAWPVMRDLGFRPIVYLPTNYIGGHEGWRGIPSPPRKLMGWDTIRGLQDEGVIFGGHTESHPDLDALAPDAVEAELTRSRDRITAELGTAPRHFAPPYGIANQAVRARIAQHYSTSVGTRLGSASAADDRHDLPRLEMFYFTDPARWRAHLAGRGAVYLALRRTLRTVRGSVLKPWRSLV